MIDIATLEKKKQLLSQKKARLQRQESLLKAGIASLDLPTLHGAFLMIAEKLNNPSVKDAWHQNYLKTQKPLKDKK